MFYFLSTSARKHRTAFYVRGADKNFGRKVRFAHACLRHTPRVCVFAECAWRARSVLRVRFEQSSWHPIYATMDVECLPMFRRTVHMFFVINRPLIDFWIETAQKRNPLSLGSRIC
jgi:hypothetical protein